MKALAKDPAERYQSGKQLLDDLEKCKEVEAGGVQEAEAPKSRSPQAERSGADEVCDPCRSAAQSKRKSLRRQRQRAGATSGCRPNRPRDLPLRKQPRRPREPAAASQSSSEVPQVDRSSHSCGSRRSMPPKLPSAYMSSAVSDEPQVETFEPQVAKTLRRLQSIP